MKKKSSTKCDREECAAYKEGHCVALIDTDFGGKECPFFKTKEQNTRERAYCRERLNKIGYGKEEDASC